MVFFGDEFPIRFDFLDTIQGGALSLQVHPKPEYIRKEFGERFTQDETYYILDCTDKATVYLGFHADIDPAKFRARLEASQQTGEPLDVESYVQRHAASKHNLFLIPHGTIHSAGEGNMILEISATPYIFTFKLYDWMRLGLDGCPRPLNIDRAFKNLDFSRAGRGVQNEFISQPRIIDRGEGWQKEDLPTHSDHFYAIERTSIEPGKEVIIPTGNSPHLLMVVEGRGIEVHVPLAVCQRFAYAETFVVPAATKEYRLRNFTDQTVMVVSSNLKPMAQWPKWMQDICSE